MVYRRGQERSDWGRPQRPASSPRCSDARSSRESRQPLQDHSRSRSSRPFVVHERAREGGRRGGGSHSGRRKGIEMLENRGRRREHFSRQWSSRRSRESSRGRARSSSQREDEEESEDCWREVPESHRRCRDEESESPETRQRCPLIPAVASRGGRVPHALFLMGLPGAGKTTVKQRRLHKGDLDIEPDQFKCRHVRFSHDMGEETDDEVHRWSVRRAADAFENALSSPRRPSLVFDSSGSNAKWLGRRISSARQAGYRIELLWVDVPVEIALFRNRDRATLGDEHGERGRWCPEEVILDKAKVLPDSFEELSKEVDSAERVQNWSERSNEKRRAEEDLYFYPAPRTRPPSLRPGDEGYGEAPPGARSPSPSRSSRRSIVIGPWRRCDEVAKRKSARLAWMDRTYRGNRERFVLERVLKRHDVVLEPNRFPYQLPPDVVHWTIWSRTSYGHRELHNYIEAWLDARQPHNCIAWNYDDNRGRRTISVWHVHIYFKGAGGKPPILRRGDIKYEREGSRDESKAKSQQSCHRSLCSPCSV